jgi:nucleoside-diphosphate-sugar epimerase
MAEPILVTGGKGFLGSHLVDELRRQGYEDVRVWGRKNGHLNHLEPAQRAMKGVGTVFHLAARVGGIGANQADPYHFWRDNLLPGLNVIHEAVGSETLKAFILVSSVCAYPLHPPHIPFREDDLWLGYPEPTNAPYGVAKRALQVGLFEASQAGHFSSACVIPTNLYGPRESFHLENSHVIPALIRKFLEARDRKLPEVTLWGTGEPTRDFLYVSDAARALRMTGETVSGGDLASVEAMNVGSGLEVQIRDLASQVARATEYEGKIVWDRSKPDGQPRRCIDTHRARRLLDWEPQVPLEDGLRRTLAWYLDNRGTPAARE